MSQQKGDSDREERIERLKAEAAAAADGPMIAWETEGLPAELREQFWRDVVGSESDETTDLVKELTAIGVPLPEPDGLDDAAVHAVLWNVIDGLTRLRVFLDQTDHLSDRELYTHLLRVVLPEEMDALDAAGGWNCHIDVLGYERPELYLKYYADEKARELWRRDFPEVEIPDHEDPPYDRDSHLPSAW